MPDTWAPQNPFLVTAGYAGPNSEGFRRCTNTTYPEEAFERRAQAEAALAGATQAAVAALAGEEGGRGPDQVSGLGVKLKGRGRL